MGERQYDIIVLGVGAMGSAASLQLARRGLKVLGLEQFEIGHDRGSSHGHTRVIRKAYFEDPRYVPMLHESFRLWRELEKQSGEKLVHLTGCLNMGPHEHIAVQGVLRSVKEHALPHEALDSREIMRRWPAIKCNDGDIGVYEEEAGFLQPERCIATMVKHAREASAEIRERVKVNSWRSEGESITVETDQGNLKSRQLVITAGAWLPLVAAEIGIPLTIERQIQAWFEPSHPQEFNVGRLPVFIHFVEDRTYYAIPIAPISSPQDRAVKVARHHGGQSTTADAVNRVVSPEDEMDIRWYLKRCLPGADGPLTASKVCLYTNTPDDHFIIDRHPRHANVFVAGGFSGHGFKFAPLIGDILADLATEGRTKHAIDLFSFARFSVTR